MDPHPDDSDGPDVMQIDDQPEPICDDDWEEAESDSEHEVPLVDDPPVLSSATAPSSTGMASSTLNHLPHPAGSDGQPIPPSVNVPPPPDHMPTEPVHVEEPVDPYLSTRPPRPPFSLVLCDWHPAVLLATILCAWLHLSGHLPFRFCDVVLTVIAQIFRELGHGTLIPSLRATLAGSLSSLQLNPQFQIFPTCPHCLKPHPESVYDDIKSKCFLCSTSLFTLDGNPLLRFPYKSLTEQLTAILAMPGMEEAMQAWRRRRRVAGRLVDIFDGLICRALRGPDGRPFFRYDLPEDPDDELRIGVVLGLDCAGMGLIKSHRFSYVRSLISQSYTSGPMSFSIINLEPHLRFRAATLLLSAIIPGPKESNPDQTQYFMVVVVNELGRLWRTGASIPTPSRPGGRIVRVILAGVFCDKLAAHKVGRFGSHNHRFFCTLDWIPQSLKATVAAFTRNAFRSRTDTQHRVVKTHFYHIWVQLKILRKNHELRDLHKILKDLSLPANLGRLPRLIGEPAGGSLTADQWLILAVTVGPLVLPQLWQNCLPDPDGVRLKERREQIDQILLQRKENRKKKVQPAANSDQLAAPEREGVPTRPSQSRRKKPSRAKKPLDEAAPVRRSTRESRPTAKRQAMVLESDDEGAMEISEDEVYPSEDDDDNASTMSTNGLHPRDLDVFLKLCSALTQFLANELTTQNVEDADRLLREYCIELLEIYGPGVIRPNHHYATHTGDFVLSYGPLREFWTFIFERLNKILKSYKTSNHDGGQIECTFFREFHRTAELYRVVRFSGTFRFLVHVSHQ
ncbi:hypothetical protein GSI_04384 [Ganoderma sinense ZZ0214-1]|uniref:Uncharacterized protein n=1 Tax=Ganoderma sinense ZZ0214-1 TaxID=1077348 RepID=A0A2G8SJ20_9APHY|nr:hypothetical protein GSI_04384 [Ganoderma sinense ZZ0214-1]